MLNLKMFVFGKSMSRSVSASRLLYHSSHINFSNIFSSTNCSMCHFSTSSQTDIIPGAMTLPRYLNSVVKFKGPISVFEYMREALTNPLHGYYMHNDVFGQSGDFITSPEINQMFGELISIWIANEWMKLNKPKPLHLIELGPGRGTMMSDILRVFKKLNLLDNVSCHLVEASPKMTRLQAKSLLIDPKTLNDEPNDTQCYCSGVTGDGVHVYWYNHFKSVPPAFSVVVAHEFFDALPIHKFRIILFQKTDKGWREVLIDSDPTDLEGKRFRYVLSPSPTVATKLFVKESDPRCEFEVSPESRIIMNELAIRLEQFGGMALIADYGHDGSLPSVDTFRAYKGHKQIDPLYDPGSADLTADVDFSYLKNNTLNKLISLGPITQKEFLSRMQIGVRMKALLEKCKDEEAKKSIVSGYNMMMDPEQMGERFKFMCFFPGVLKDYLEKMPVAGFSS
ncbi:hypothetical protein LSTR_LSTR012506 [Laodelphax striatellus]|uniref:Protein arginine methyltransferase NDUFAF7 n=1 Tax=Laodelphax striatellus TaxID=195883 RepID=A0A482XMH6_LAOST|nr:hypothetical protein LSTR_LSTR012506 [Laodelphax striatellus]